MKFIWSTNAQPMSWLIRSALGEDCSHFSILLDWPERIFESRVQSGVTTTSVSDFRKRNRIIHCLDAPLVTIDREQQYARKLAEKLGAPYDGKAILWWALTFWGRRLTRENRWGDSRAFYCVEITSDLEEMLWHDFQVNLTGYDIEMLSPHDLYRLLAVSPKLHSISW